MPGIWYEIEQMFATENVIPSECFLTPFVVDNVQELFQTLLPHFLLGMLQEDPVIILPQTENGLSISEYRSPLRR